MATNKPVAMLMGRWNGTTFPNAFELVSIRVVRMLYRRVCKEPRHSRAIRAHTAFVSDVYSGWQHYYHGAQSYGITEQKAFEVYAHDAGSNVHELCSVLFYSLMYLSAARSIPAGDGLRLCYVSDPNVSPETRASGKQKAPIVASSKNGAGCGA